MKLSEVLKVMVKPVKIGTHNGSGFVYIGRPENALETLNTVPRYEGSPRWEDREVLETYNAALVIDSTRIIIVEGKEKGGRWYLGEENPVFGKQKKMKEAFT